jgi:hypothetical protein
LVEKKKNVAQAIGLRGWTTGGDRNDVVGHKNQDPKKREIILFFIKKIKNFLCPFLRII